MLRDLTIGQYYPGDSIIHRLDPRVKIICTLLFVISLFTFQGYIGYAVVALFLAVVIGLSKIPVSFIFKGVKAILFLLILTVLFNLFLIPGEPVVEIWKFTITDAGVRTAIATAFRLLFLIFGSSLMTLTTTPNQLTDGLERILNPLRVIKVPVHELAMMMSIALRFIPILLEETDKIMKAQIARGADFESGNLIKKAKSLVPLLVPLFVSAFRRALDLAMAMEARCYRGGSHRTKMKPLKYARKDYLAYVLMILYVAVLVCIVRIVK